MESTPVSETEPLSKKRKLSTYRICPHCKKELTIKKFKEHRNLFYDPSTRVWIKDPEAMATCESDESDFSEFNEVEEVSDKSECDWNGFFAEQDTEESALPEQEQPKADQVAAEDGKLKG